MPLCGISRDLSAAVLNKQHLKYTKNPLRVRHFLIRGGRNRIGRREKWPKQSWEEGEIGGKSREEGEKET